MSKNAQVLAVVKVGNVRRLAQLLECSNIDPNYVDEYGWTALHYGADKGHQGAVELLLQKSINTEVQDMFGRTALHIAIQKHHVNIVKKLLEFNADAESRDKDGRTCLHIATSRGRVDLIEIFLDHGVDIEALDNDWKTPLHWACLTGRKDIVSYLLDQGANRSTKTKEGADAVSIASTKGHQIIVELLRNTSNTQTKVKNTKSFSKNGYAENINSGEFSASSPAWYPPSSTAQQDHTNQSPSSPVIDPSITTSWDDPILLIPEKNPFKGIDIFEQTIRTMMKLSPQDELYGECMIFESYFTLIYSVKEDWRLFEHVYLRFRVSFEQVYTSALTMKSACVFVQILKYILITLYRQYLHAKEDHTMMIPINNNTMNHADAILLPFTPDASLQSYLEDILSTPNPPSSAATSSAGTATSPASIKKYITSGGNNFIVTTESMWLLDTVGVYLTNDMTNHSHTPQPQTPPQPQQHKQTMAVDCKAIAYYLLIRYYLSSSTITIRPLRMKKIHAFEEYVMNELQTARRTSSNTTATTAATTATATTATTTAGIAMKDGEEDCYEKVLVEIIKQSFHA